MLCNLSASEWFDLYEIDIFQSIRFNQCWPWLNMTQSEWSSVTETLIKTTCLRQLIQLSILVISPLGILGSIFGILSLWQKGVKERQRFYAWMLIISILDLVYSPLLILNALSVDQLFDDIYKYSYEASQFILLFEGLVYGFSLAADLCSLQLTIERYLAVNRLKKLQHKQKVVITVVSVVIISIGFVLRFIRYGFQYTTDVKDLEKSQVEYTFVYASISETQWFNVIVFISDVLLPFVLLTCMIYFSLRIAIILIKRRRARVHDSASQAQQQNIEQQSNNMLRLLLVLVILFVCNQLGYCFYTICVLLSKSNSIDFDSSYSEVVIYANIQLYWNFTSLVSQIMECLSRSANFYLYYLLSVTIREEFRKVLCKFGNRE